MSPTNHQVVILLGVARWPWLLQIFAVSKCVIGYTERLAFAFWTQMFSEMSAARCFL